MKANCVAPVKTSSDIAHACTTLSPLVTARAPNDAPYTPVAIPDPEAVADDGASVMRVHVLPIGRHAPTL